MYSIFRLGLILTFTNCYENTRPNSTHAFYVSAANQSEDPRHYGNGIVVVDYG